MKHWSMKLILLFVIATLVLPTGIESVSALSKPASGCFISTARPTQLRDGTLVSQAAFRCYGAYEFTGLPYFKVCTIRRYKSWWTGRWKEQTVACSRARPLTPNGQVQTVSSSCGFGEGNYYTEARWKEGTVNDFLAVVGLPPSSLGEVAIDQLITSPILDWLFSGDKAYRHPSWFVCT